MPMKPTPMPMKTGKPKKPVMPKKTGMAYGGMSKTTGMNMGGMAKPGYGDQSMPKVPMPMPGKGNPGKPEPKPGGDPRRPRPMPMGMAKGGMAKKSPAKKGKK
jgi:hypothetical protein